MCPGLGSLCVVGVCGVGRQRGTSPAKDSASSSPRRIRALAQGAAPRHHLVVQGLPVLHLTWTRTSEEHPRTLLRVTQLVRADPQTCAPSCTWVNARSFLSKVQESAWWGDVPSHSGHSLTSPLSFSPSWPWDSLAPPPTPVTNP